MPGDAQYPEDSNQADPIYRKTFKIRNDFWFNATPNLALPMVWIPYDQEKDQSLK